ncbi:MAG: hypothetical protein GC152_10825 [Alphaproteobacteria bacterium]|nr:hypothetical protein [Alphaproteobacteria bacterium]
MGLTLFFVGLCVAFGGIAAMLARGPIDLPEIPRPISAEDIRRFSPRNTLFIIGPTADHAACRLQRRLLKPAIPLVIREDVKVIEIYGDATARLNGDPLSWLDPALLRHAMDAEDGFYVIFVDDRGRTVFRSEHPMVATDIFARAGLDIAPARSASQRKSTVLNKLRAA